MHQYHHHDERWHGCCARLILLLRASSNSEFTTTTTSARALLAPHIAHTTIAHTSAYSSYSKQVYFVVVEVGRSTAAYHAL